METYTLSQFPYPYSTIHIALFQNVTNSPTIRKRLIAASTAKGPEGEVARTELDYAFLEGRLVVSREYLLTAIQATLLSTLPSTDADGITKPRTRTHNLHSELLFSLSPNNNISDSVRRHGIGDDSDVVVVVRIGAEGSQEEVFNGMKVVVDGQLVGLGDLEKTVNWAKVDKIYKLSDLKQLPLTSEQIIERKVAVMINTIAIKSVI